MTNRRVPINENVDLMKSLNEVKTVKTSKGYKIPDAKQIVKALYKDKKTRASLRRLAK